MLNELKRMQLLAGILKEGMSDQEWSDAKEAERLDAYPEKDKIKGIQDMMANEKGEKDEAFDHEQDDYEGAIVDDFTVGDWVKSKSSNVGGQVVGTNWRDNSVSVKLPNGQLQKFDANELVQDPYEDDEEDHEGTWADFKGDEKFFKEDGKVIPFRPKKEKGVHIDDFEDEHHGSLDDYVRKLVDQQTSKGKQIQFTPKKDELEEKTLEHFLQEEEDDMDDWDNAFAADNKTILKYHSGNSEPGEDTGKAILDMRKNKMAPGDYMEDYMNLPGFDQHLTDDKGIRIGPKKYVVNDDLYIRVANFEQAALALNSKQVVARFQRIMEYFEIDPNEAQYILSYRKTMAKPWILTVVGFSDKENQEMMIGQHRDTQGQDPYWFSFGAGKKGLSLHSVLFRDM